jgi:hypothetical protein
MAIEEVYSVSVSPETGKSLSDLKKEFKEQQAELSKLKVGTKEYQTALEKLGAVKDDIGDLRDTISALNPEGKVAAFAKVGSTIASGFAAAQGAAALFGAESEELQKTMLKVQAAMALAEGIKGITAAGDAFRVLNTVMKANPILAIVAGFTALATTVAVLYKNYLDANSASANLQKTHEKLVETNKVLNKEYEIQIKALSGLKENEGQINEIKEKQIKANIELAKSSLAVALAKQAEAESSSTLEEQLLRASGQDGAANLLRFSRIQEQRKATQDSITDLKSALADLSNFHNIQEQKIIDKETEVNKKSVEDARNKAKEKIQAEKDYLDAYERSLAAQIKAQEQAAAESKKISDGILKSQHDILMQQSHEEGEVADKEFLALQNRDALKKAHHQSTLNERIAAEEEHRDLLLQNENLTQEERVNIIQASESKVRAEKQKTTDSYVNATRQGLQATQQLTDLYFAHQLKQSKGNAAAELELRKKQFKVNKAFGVVNAVVDGVGAVQKALNNPYPLNIVLAVISGLAAAANIAKIVSTKFEGGETSSTPDLAQTASAPVIPTPNNTATKISDEGVVTKVDTKPQDQRVYVLQGDIAREDKKVANIEQTAKIS